MNNRGLLDIIISLIPAIRPVDRIYLLQKFDGEDDFILQSKREIEKILNIRIHSGFDIDGIRAIAEKTASVCMKRSIHWVSYNDAEYPPLLREIYDPPSVIFYKGKLPNPEKPLLGMVGTRKPSPESAAQAFSIGYGVGQAGISVVSGLALGIDAMSHRGNLTAGIPGYAVLGSGADEVYPSSNKPLAKLILDSGGALLTEYPPGSRPARWTFPARNRIISALSRSVIIVEAPAKSGALITADFSLQHGKEIWVASSGLQQQQYGSLDNKMGTIKLASEGADIIYSASDVLEKWKMDFGSSFDAAEHTNEKDIISSMANYLQIEL